MKQTLLLFIVCLHICLTAQVDEATTASVISFGNLADIDQKEAFAKELRTYVFDHPDLKALVINGDLMHEDDRLNDQLKSIDSFFNILSLAPIKIIVIPGDRDWDNNGKLGWDKVKILENYFYKQNYANVVWPLSSGCPGPSLIDIGPDLKLIAVQTQWWNHPHLIPTPATTDCDIATPGAFFETLEGMMEEYSSGNLIIAGHMPLISNGRYGGRFPLKDWILPVPIISTFKTSFKQNIGHVEHISNERFSTFREELLEMFADHFSMIYLSGHDRQSEVLLRGKNILINSGAPAAEGYVAPARNDLFQKSGPGFIKIRFLSDGAAFADFVGYKNNAFNDALNTKIFQAPCAVPLPSMPVNERLVPCATPPDVLDQMAERHAKTVVHAANEKYKASKLQEKWLGKHYRTSWAQPVELSVLDLDTTFGGLTPFLMGGGNQTLSLRLRAQNGSDYVFRSVDKDPDRGLSVPLRSTLLSVVLKDQITTQQPYGAPVVSHLLDHTQILHARPQPYIMPDDQKLGPFQEMFGGMLGYLEERPSTNLQGQRKHYNEDRVSRTIEMFRSMYTDHHHGIARAEYLEARMFDILIGDWARGEDNWYWAAYESDDQTLYRPIPKDRDDAFSLWDGIIPWLADREWAKDAGESFESKIVDMRSLTWESRHMDRLLANQSDRQDWTDAAISLQQQITPEKIDDAINQMPPEIIALAGDRIAQKLKTRIKALVDHSNTYYDLLAKEVDIVGTIHREKFDITIREDQTVDVKMYSAYREEGMHLIYERTFSPDETKEIRIFGLQDNDIYNITENRRSKILIRLIPGIGIDSINGQSAEGELAASKRIKNFILYDTPGSATLTGRPIKFSSAPNLSAYRYDRTAFQYNKYFPIGFLYYTGDNGVSLLAGVEFTNQKYGKPDFSSKHKFEVLASSIGNIQLSYQGRWRHIFKKWDFVVNLSNENRNRFRYLFNFKSAARFSNDQLRAGYHTLQFRTLQTQIGILNEYWKFSQTYFGLSIERHSDQLQENTILDNELSDLLGKSALRIAKVHADFDLDFRDKKYLPKRGLRFHTQNFAGTIFKGGSGAYGKNLLGIEYFTTLHPMTLGIGLGAAYHHGEIPFYDREFYGQNNHLRGFRRNRLSGRKMQYLNADIRLEIFNKPAAVVPFQLGLKFFYDAANVQIRDENTQVNVIGYGAGLYFVPVKEEYVFNFMFGFSDEEKGLFILSVGKDF